MPLGNLMYNAELKIMSYNDFFPIQLAELKFSSQNKKNSALHIINYEENELQSLLLQFS